MASTSSLRRDLRTSMRDAAAYSLMVGLGEAYLPAFALALGMAEVTAGMVATVPMLIGASMQMISPWAVSRLNSHRTWVVACAGCQAVSLLVLPLAILLGGNAGPLVFAAASLYWGAGLATAPAWNTWIESIVPRHVRTSFFARRVRIGQICTLLGFAIAGLSLQAGQVLHRPLVAFALLFIAAASCRLVSSWYLSLHREPRVAPGSFPALKMCDWMARFRGHASGKLLVYLFSVQVAVQISGPFFTPFMLSKLKLTYLEYMLVIGTAYVTKAVALAWLGRFARRFGARRLLVVGGIGIIPMSGTWYFSNSFGDLMFGYLILIQIVSGLAWAAYELAMFLMFFEAIEKHERTSLLTLYNFGNAVAMVGGATLGGLLLAGLGSGHQAYLALFLASSLARIGTLLLLARVPGRATQPLLPTPVAGTIAIRPMSGSIDRPILPSVSDGPPVPRHHLQVASSKAKLIPESLDSKASLKP